MVLVDTSVWIDHLRNDNGRLAALLPAAQVVVHPFVIGELALGTLRRRAAVLADVLLWTFDKRLQAVAELQQIT